MGSFQWSGGFSTIEGWGQKLLHIKTHCGFYSLEDQIYVLLHGEGPQMRRQILAIRFGVCSDFYRQHLDSPEFVSEYNYCIYDIYKNSYLVTSA